MEKTIMIGVIFILFINAYAGYKKGFMHIVLNLLTILLSMALATGFMPIVSNAIQKNTGLYNYSKGKVQQSIRKELNKKKQENEILEALPLPSDVKQKLEKNTAISDFGGAASFEEYIGDSMAKLIINLISFIILYCAFRILLSVLISVFDLLRKLPVIHEMDNLLGLTLGVMEGILFIWILCLVLMAFAGTSEGREIYAIVKNNDFLQFFYEHNLLETLINSLFDIL